MNLIDLGKDIFSYYTYPENLARLGKCQKGNPKDIEQMNIYVKFIYSEKATKFCENFKESYQNKKMPFSLQGYAILTTLFSNQKFSFQNSKPLMHASRMGCFLT